MKKIFLKNSAHAYFGRLHFSKFFGGKITAFSTDVTYRITIIIFKNQRMRIECPCFFASLLAGNWGLEREKLDKEE